ncbi:MAG: AAA family ATPase [Bacteroidota bacterium]|jgi:HTH-type transcriptional repressor of NAD biosynthesis genes|nr:AAA family ATPase [Cytophagales bacterium]MCE2955922.1 AAA family ATPase [Flammeovirgaceae bacterium]MCZ8070375.1 AAA family ATPase [Cytophagales bacterium]
MKRGLVIGKFMPVHNGHLALIGFAKSQCNELIVSMSYTLIDPIDHNIRFGWLKQLLADDPNVRVEESLDDFDDESVPLFERTKVWARFIQKRFPKIDLVISSESYGEPFAHHLGVPHVLFDLHRAQVPVSATLVREKPLTYWNYIPKIVQPYFVKKVCLYGPESTGKSVMAKKLADLYQTEWVPEVAREFVSSNVFTVEEIVKIGNAHVARIAEKEKIANRFLFCDTDIITTQIYCNYYLHTVPPVLFELEKQVRFDAYFLFDIDVPWVADGMRDLSHLRKQMFETFKSELERRSLPYTFVQGNWDQRLQIVEQKLGMFN